MNENEALLARLEIIDETLTILNKRDDLEVQEFLSQEGHHLPVAINTINLFASYLVKETIENPDIKYVELLDIIRVKIFDRSMQEYEERQEKENLDFLAHYRKAMAGTIEFVYGLMLERFV